MKKKCKILKAQFGLEQIADITLQLPNVITTLSTPFQNSNATNSKQATVLSLTDIGSGVATGASVGSMFGPVGAIVGGIGGAAIGLIGRKGEKASMTSFTDYDEGTLGTGLVGAFNNKKLRRERTRIKNNAWNNRAAVAGTLNLLSDYYTNTLDAVVNLANGGSINSLAYVDDGELIKTPDGNISKIPELGKPTDSNLVSLPNGSRVLSNTLKVPGTNKTFALMGEDIMSRNKIDKKTNDIYANNTRKLNKINNNMAYNKLFELLELLKNKKGIKPKKKLLISKAKDGIQIPNFSLFDTDINSTIITPDKLYELNRLFKIGENYRLYRKNEEKRLLRQLNFSKVLNIIGNAASSISSIAPILSNLFTSNEKPVEAVYNPYSNAALRIYSNRRYNPNEAINAINKLRAISNYNANYMNTDTGANMAYRLASLIGTLNSIADVYAQTNNINNLYMTEYANMLNNAGNSWQQATLSANELNAANRANTRNIRRTGLSQLSQLMLTRELMNNQKAMDLALLQLYGPFMKYGYTDRDWNAFKNYSKIGG